MFCLVGLQAQYSFDNDGDKTPTSTLADIFDGRAFSDDGRAFSEKSKLGKHVHLSNRLETIGL